MMNYDFKIDKIFLIEHTYGKCETVLKTKKGFYFGEEEDNDTEEQAYETFLAFLERPRNHVVIFDNKCFTKERYRIKYVPLVLSILEDDDDNIITMNDIIRVTLFERLRQVSNH